MTSHDPPSIPILSFHSVGDKEQDPPNQCLGGSCSIAHNAPIDSVTDRIVLDLSKKYLFDCIKHSNIHCFGEGYWSPKCVYA